MIHSNFSKKFNHGFTLIELMIVVAIVGILAAIVYPMYSDSILKARRAEGRKALLELLQQQERFFTQNGRYSMMTGADASAFKNFSGDNLENSHYSLTAQGCAAPNDNLNLCITLIATPNKTDAVVGSLTVDSTGIKSCINGTDTTKSKCWN